MENTENNLSNQFLPENKPEAELPDPLATPELPINTTLQPETPIEIPNKADPQGTNYFVPPEPAPPAPTAKGFGINENNKTRKGSGFIKNILFFLILFVIGIALSFIMRQFFSDIKLPGGLTEIFKISNSNSKSSTLASVSPTISPVSEIVPNLQEIEIKTNTNPPVIVISIPADVKPLTCDTVNCISQGTYLSGGTRLTVSPRIKTGALNNFQKAVMTDANGKTFVTKDATISGKIGIEYSGDFNGLTTGGFRFTKMHGYLLQLTDTLLIEISHFSPSGITADFTGDDQVFENTVSSIKTSEVINIPTVRPTVGQMPNITLPTSATSSNLP